MRNESSEYGIFKYLEIEHTLPSSILFSDLFLQKSHSPNGSVNLIGMYAYIYCSLEWTKFTIQNTQFIYDFINDICNLTCQYISQIRYFFHLNISTIEVSLSHV